MLRSCLMDKSARLDPLWGRSYLASDVEEGRAVRVCRQGGRHDSRLSTLVRNVGTLAHHWGFQWLQGCPPGYVGTRSSSGRPAEKESFFAGTPSSHLAFSRTANWRRAGSELATTRTAEFANTRCYSSPRPGAGEPIGARHKRRPDCVRG